MRPKSRDDGPPRPNLPRDEEPQLAKGVIREIDRVLGKGPRARDVALAVSIGSAAIDDERPDVAVEVLAWAKSQAPRIPTIREAYGVALYHLGRFDEALAELQAYRRMTHRNDQNHVIADCERALGRPTERIAATCEQLVDDLDAPVERRAEAAIVWAGALADADDVRGARAVLRRFRSNTRVTDEDAKLRLAYLEGDLAERAGDRDAAREAFADARSIDDDFLDVRDRYDALTSSEG